MLVGLFMTCNLEPNKESIAGIWLGFNKDFVYCFLIDLVLDGIKICWLDSKEFALKYLRHEKIFKLCKFLTKPSS